MDESNSTFVRFGNKAVINVDDVSTVIYDGFNTTATVVFKGPEKTTRYSGVLGAQVWEWWCRQVADVLPEQPPVDDLSAM